MNVTLRIIWCMTTFAFAGLYPVRAQDKCELVLNHAQEEFNAGHFYVIPDLLKECIEQNRNKGWQQRAYLLLAETYLLLEDAAGAEASYLKVLGANPEFVTREDRDPMDLVYLSRKFTATPVFSVSGKFGTNVSPVRVIHDIDIGGEPNTQENYYLKFGFQGGVGVDWHYSSRIAVGVELNYSLTAFRHETRELFGAHKDRVTFIDRQSWLNFPLLIKYGSDVGKIRPYGYGGYASSVLFGDRASIEISNRDVSATQENELITEPSESPTLSYQYKRQTNHYAVIVGGGIKYKNKLDYFFADVRYGMGLNNQVNQQTRYQGITDRWPYVDDDFRLDNLSFSIGFIHPFYNPRKLKKAKTKSVLRRIKKDEHVAD